MWKRKPAVFNEQGIRYEIGRLLKVLENPVAPLWEQRQRAALTLASRPLTLDEQHAAKDCLTRTLNRRLHEPLYRRMLRPLLRPLKFTITVTFFINTVISVIRYCYDLNAPGPFELLAWVIICPLIMGVFISAYSFPFVLPFALTKDVVLDSYVRAAAAKSLGTIGDAQSVAVLADALSDFNSKVRNEASNALPQLLSTLLAAPDFRLSSHATTRLCRALMRQSPAGLQLSLRAIEKGGTSQAIPYLEHLFEAYGRPYAADVTSSQKTIAEILLLLHERKRLEEQRDRLVRPTTAPADASLLLRPARTAETGDISILLRPTQTDSNGR